MENPWLTVTLSSPLNPSIPVGNLSHSPPIPDPPDPPDPLQFPPLPSPLSGGQKPPKKLRFYRSFPNPTVPSPPIPSPPTTSVAAVPVSSSGAATSAPSTADLLASFISLPPLLFQNRDLDWLQIPAYSLIQNVLNYLWGKGKHLEIHMLPQSNSVLRSAHTEDFTPSLQKIQLWAHLKGVPFDLIYDAGLSHIAGQIGEPKETDDWTLSLSSISVAHVKVEIDTTVPLPSKVEVGRMNGTFVTVEVEYPWIPPSCAHCKEVGHIQRHCPLLPPPSPLFQSKSHRPLLNLKNSGPRNQPSPSQSSKKPPPANKFCFSCRATGHLMNNCPKGPADWTLVNRQISHPSTSTIPSSVTPFSPPPLSSSQPKPTLPQPPFLPPFPVKLPHPPSPLPP
ncbi:uncharacterized protein LOC130500009 [Raphanus sativus]|uniref:Uncharacterized protein LOC130500009 n=1 Tax=Raphanus sativus TaxID=3726 RepID=A0A9W3CGX2_RAPSA|nr:uncharacterized protein LOC130500009 [Raphanus sativus]